jgi:hypothetical protein
VLAAILASRHPAIVRYTAQQIPRFRTLTESFGLDSRRSERLTVLPRHTLGAKATQARRWSSPHQFVGCRRGENTTLFARKNRALDCPFGLGPLCRERIAFSAVFGVWKGCTGESTYRAFIQQSHRITAACHAFGKCQSFRAWNIARGDVDGKCYSGRRDAN